MDHDTKTPTSPRPIKFAKFDGKPVNSVVPIVKNVSEAYQSRLQAPRTRLPMMRSALCNKKPDVQFHTDSEQYERGQSSGYGQASAGPVAASSGYSQASGGPAATSSGYGQATAGHLSNLKRNVQKRDGASSSADVEPKRTKVQDKRVAALQTKKAARRSVSRAINIARAKSTKTDPPPMSTQSKSRSASTRTARLASQAPRPSSTRAPASRAAAAVKKPPARPTSVSPANPSSAASNGGKKPKRKPWDLKGQLSDAQEELQTLRQQSGVMQNIMNRLDALEQEKSFVQAEKSRLSTNLSRQQGNNLELERKLQEKESELVRLNSTLDEMKRAQRALQQDRDELDIENRRWKSKYEALSDEKDRVDVKNKQLETDNGRLGRELAECKSELAAKHQELVEQELDRKHLHNLVQELKGNIRVYCRLRPLLEKERAEGGDNHITITSDTKLTIENESNKVLPYSFDRVFPASSTQQQVFDDISQLVQSALDGYNVCIFAYGQTGAGKTYTMEGPDRCRAEDAGIIPRSMHLIFQKCESLANAGWTHTLAVQQVEIYKETLRDLLSTNTNLEIKTFDKKGGHKIWVKNLSEHPVASYEQMEELLQLSKKKRATAATSANERSSRSHAVFILKIAGSNRDTGENVQSALNLIDLAGSENISESSGERLKEAQKINGSLTELSNVISALANKGTHVPYRNSKLTFLLADSLGGNSKTLMFVNVNPARKCTNETLNTLRFGTNANKCNIGTAQKVVKFDK